VRSAWTREGRDPFIDAVGEIVCAAGQRPDLTLTSELRVKLDPWPQSNEAPGLLIDPNLHRCGTVSRASAPSA
jgi:hypothetical protein